MTRTSCNPNALAGGRSTTAHAALSSSNSRVNGKPEDIRPVSIAGHWIAGTLRSRGSITASMIASADRARGIDDGPRSSVPTGVTKSW